MRVQRVVLIACAAALVAGGAGAGEVKVEPDQKFLLLSTTKTDTMEQELTDAAKLGFRIVLSAPSGAGMLMLMERTATPPDTYKYRLLATSKVSTMEKELNEVAREGYRLLPRAIMPKTKLVGPKEIVCVTEMSPQGAKEKNHEYKVLGTGRTSTMEKEIRENQAAGYALIGMATANEHTVIMEREVR